MTKKELRKLPTYTAGAHLFRVVEEFANMANGKDKDEKARLVASMVLGMRESTNPVLRHMATIFPLVFLTTGDGHDPMAELAENVCKLLEEDEASESNTKKKEVICH